MGTVYSGPLSSYSAASTQGPPFLMLIVLVCLYLLRAVAAVPVELQQAVNPGYIALPITKRTIETPYYVSQTAFQSSLNLNSVTSHYVDVTIGSSAQQVTMALDTRSTDVWVYGRELPPSMSRMELLCGASAASAIVTQADLIEGYLKGSTTSVPCLELDPFRVTGHAANSPPLGHYVNETLSIGGISTTFVVGIVSYPAPGDLPGGVIGIAPVSGATGACSSQKRYPGFIETLVTQGSIEVGAYSIFLDQLNRTGGNHGTVIFGGQDRSRYIGDLVPFDIAEAPDSETCQLDINRPAINVNAGGQAYPIAPCKDYTVLFDTGSPVILLPRPEFTAIASIVGATPRYSGAVIHLIPCSYANASGGIDFAFSGPYGDTTIAVPWRELVLPDDSLPAGQCFFGLAPDTEDLDVYLFGETFVRSAYLLFNYDDATISLAPASYDTTCDNCLEPLLKPLQR